MIAAGRKHRNESAIGVVNLFLGWTLVGWVGAFAWALTAQEKLASASAESIDANGARIAADLERLVALKESGALSEEEFENAKKRVLAGEREMPWKTE